MKNTTDSGNQGRARHHDGPFSTNRSGHRTPLVPSYRHLLIGTFGEDPDLATDMARAYVGGFQTSEGDAGAKRRRPDRDREPRASD